VVEAEAGLIQLQVVMVDRAAVALIFLELLA
jgi:hypothetical protein